MRVPLWTIPAVLLAVSVLGLSFACGGDSNEGEPSTDGVYPTATLPADLPEVFMVSGTPQAPSGNDGSTYVIQEGDTLSSIAERFNVALDDLISINNIVDPTGLHAGDEITIPRPGNVIEPETQDEPTAGPIDTPTENPPAEPTSAAEDGTYTVQEGDTPASIAAQFGITADELMEANGITDATSLLIGDVLTIPGQ